MTNVPKPWATQADQLLSALGVDADEGLTEQEATQRLRRFGPNLTRAVKPRSLLSILLDQFKGAVIVLLSVAAVVAVLFGDTLEGFAILAVILINTGIGFITEWRAMRSMEALRQMGRVETVVRRDGCVKRIHSDRLVPGDITVFEAGDLVTADSRLVETSKLQVNESSLSGESNPVSKETGCLPDDTGELERNNLLFKGTTITRGSGLGVVYATGSNTRLGKISLLVAEAEAQVTPLEKRLNALGRRLVWVMLLISVLIAGTGIFMGRDVFLAIEVAIALAVAAIPEGLPIVATIALARGMKRMARRNALVSRLSAVETLGATGIILTDKTGTLTENRMSVHDVLLPEGEIVFCAPDESAGGRFLMDGMEPGNEVLTLLDGLLQAVVLCNNASLDMTIPKGANSVGDPTEIALLMAGAKRNIRQTELSRDMPELREEPFDPETKSMATFNKANGFIRISVKGAPESVLPNCVAVRTVKGDQRLDDDQRKAWLERAHAMGCDGLRTLAVAGKTTQSVDANPYQDLVLLGIIGLLDPPRSGVKETIERFRKAGIRIIMVTGDHAATAGNIAGQVGLASPESIRDGVRDASASQARRSIAEDAGSGDVLVFARVTPRQKLELIEHYQKQGNVVAMTGDGVNDAPALKKADIGVAMGIRGTAVAKEAAAMVLLDDDFSTIAEAIAQGRTIYDNIRKFVVYLFSCNISEILIVTLATLAGAPLPLLPLQILFLNLVTDVFPALALGVGPGSAEVMDRKPRPAHEPLLTRQHWILIAAHGVLISAAVLGAMALARSALGFSDRQAITISFCTLALAQLWHVFNMRDQGREWLVNEITRNAWVWCALGLCLLLVLGAVYLPGANILLKLIPPGPAGWLLILVMSLVPLLLGPVIRKLSGRLA